jgi:hypothetical protein
MAFDSARNRTVLFGGLAPITDLTAKLFSDTWEWDGTCWTQMADIGPDARMGAGMAFDQTRGRLILFGGNDSEMPGNNPKLLGDTWEWSGEGWTQIAENGPARVSGGMAADPLRERITLFGGSALNGADQTWEWDGTAWTQQEDSGPGFRSECALAFDVAGERTILFGGSSPASGTQTWAWNGKTWAQLSDIGPGRVSGHAMASTADGILLFGGVRHSGDFGATLIGETWMWKDGRWSQRQDMGPAPRFSAGLAYDKEQQMAVLFGGFLQQPGGAVLGDTWDAPIGVQIP